MSPHRTLPPLHVVTDDAVVARPAFRDDAAAVLQAGGERLCLHLRAPHASGRRVYEMAAWLRPLASEAGALLLVNDRADVALLWGDGLQVGSRGLPVAAARRVLGAERLLGASVHAASEASAAAAAGADFLLAGPVWPTPSHPDAAAAGLALVAACAAAAPTVAIGGVTPARAAEARAAGATGVAAVRGVWEAPDPAAAVNDYLRSWKG